MSKRLDVMALKRAERLVESEFLLSGSSAWVGVRNSGIELFEELIADNVQCAKAVKKFLGKLTNERLSWNVFVLSFYEVNGAQFQESVELQFNNLDTQEFDLHIKDAVEYAFDQSKFTREEWCGYAWYAKLVDTNWDAVEDQLVQEVKAQGVYDETVRKLVQHDYHSERAQKEREQARAVMAQLKL